MNINRYSFILVKKCISMAKPQAAQFNPVKEDNSGKRARSMIWSTKVLDMALDGLNKGKKLVSNPFYENNTKLLKSDLVFQRTKEETKEFARCMNDVIYFAKKCKLMTPEGIQFIELRPYQEKYLRHLQQNRLSIYLAARQSGKCLTFLSEVQCIIPNDLIDKIKTSALKNYLIKDNEYKLPLFELYNLFDNSLLWKIEYYLYKLIYRYEKKRISQKLQVCMLYAIVGILDKLRKSDTKLIKSFDVAGIEVLTDTGYQPISYIHMTKAFEIYEISTSNNLYLSCADTHIVFDNNMNQVYVQDLHVGDEIQTEYGIAKIIKINHTSRKVCMCDITVNDNNHRFYSNGILSHNTTTSAIFLLWYVLFNFDKNALVLGNKGKTSKEILDKIKKIFYELPYYLKPGIEKWNEMELCFDNGCRILGETTTARSGISFTFHCVLADEFAHIPANIMDEFYENIFPTITAAKARFILSSTQNGYNLFQRLWAGAVTHENEYAPFKTDWYEVPEWNPDKKCWEKRDEEWMNRQIANYGGEAAFNRQFGTAFDSNANGLISNKIMQTYSLKALEYRNLDVPILFGEDFYWNPNIDIMRSLKEDYIIITCDLAEGLGGDYTVFQFNRMVFRKQTNDIGYENIGYYRSNSNGLQKSASILRKFCLTYMIPSRYYISVEMNTYGELFVRMLQDEIDNEANFADIYKFNMDVLLRFAHNDNIGGTASKIKYRIGVKLDNKTKILGCLTFKSWYESGKLVNYDSKLINELYNFCDTTGNSSYKASYGHDDMVMSQLQLAFFEKSTIFKTIKDSIIAEGLHGKMQANMYSQPESGLSQLSWNVAPDSGFFNNSNDFYDEEYRQNYSRLASI